MAHSSKMLQFSSFLLLFFSIPQSFAAPTNSVSTSNAVNPLILTRKHFAELVQYFNTRGWIWDYGGGIAVRVVQPTAIGKELVYVSANKYMKSFYQAEDIFVYDHNEVMQPEYLANKTLPQAISSARDSGDPSVEASSAMNMLRFANYERQKNANFSANEFVALMHTHSKFSNLLSGMSQPGDVISIQGEQMTNCIEDRSTGQNFAYTDELLIPIIRNDPNEAMFTEPMMELLWKYPKANAIIMHRHGIFVWGQNTWERTKQMLECYEYILEVEYQRRQRIMLENLLAKVSINGTV